MKREEPLKEKSKWIPDPWNKSDSGIVSIITLNYY